MARREENTPLGESIGDIVDRTTKLVHEEIELAKSEMRIAWMGFLRGSVAAIIAGVFAFFGLFVLLIAFSFLVADAIGILYPWLGFFIVAAACFSIGLALAVLAYKKMPTVPEVTLSQTVDEARETRSALKNEMQKDVETIASTADEEPTLAKTVDRTFPVVGDVKPVVTPEMVEGEAGPVDAEPAEVDAVSEAKEELAEAREEADELELDAKEAKRRAKREAKEAKQAAKEAKKAEAEAAKAEAMAAKKAEKAANEAEKAKQQEEKAKQQAEKDAAKAAKKTAKAKREPAAGEEFVEPSEPQRYVAPQPPAEQSPAQAPPAQAPPAQAPPAPPSDPTENK